MCSAALRIALRQLEAGSRALREAQRAMENEVCGR